MTSTETGFLHNLATGARENPLAAALIGAGALWLLMDNEKLKNVAHSATAATSTLADMGARQATAFWLRTDAPPTVPEMDHGATFHPAEGLNKATGVAADLVSATTQKIKHRLSDGADYARQKAANLGSQLPGRESITQAQSYLADLLERQPLVLGVVGLAIGAAAGGAFGSSDLENEWLGEFSDDIKADLKVRAAAVSQSVVKASDKLKAELGDRAAEGAGRLKQAGMDAGDAARQEIGIP